MVTGTTRAIMATTVATITPTKDNKDTNSNNINKVMMTTTTTEGGGHCPPHSNNCGGGSCYPWDAAIKPAAALR